MTRGGRRLSQPWLDVGFVHLAPTWSDWTNEIVAAMQLVSRQARQRLFKVSLGTVEWYRNSYGTESDISGIASPV